MKNFKPNDEDVKRLMSAASDIFQEKLRNDENFKQMCSSFCETLISDPNNIITEENQIHKN